MANYGVNYRLDFCDKDLNRACRIDILRRDYSGAVLPFIGGAEPMSILYKNDSDSKFEQITNSQGTINITASDAITLKTFYTGDEREFIVKLYIEGKLEWSGFVMPDSSKEPFLTAPYNASLKATDLMSTLSSIPYTNELGRPIKKVDSVKNILLECLNKTGLNLDLFIGINTYEDTFAKGVNDCPLDQAYVDTNRFIDTNNKPYSCFDIIKYFCSQFSSNIKQAHGAWWLVNIDELRGLSYRVRQYDFNGTKLGNQLISNLRRAGLNLPIQSGFKTPLTLIGRDHDIQNIPGYKSATTYYQFGYLSNKLLNGDLNKILGGPLLCPFENWNSYGNLSIGYGEKTEVIDNTGIRKPNGDKYAIINNYKQASKYWDRVDVSKGMYSDAISVLTNDRINVSFGIGSSDASKITVVFVNLALNFPGKPTLYWSSPNWVENKPLQVYSAPNTSTDNEVSVSFQASPPPYGGNLSLYIYGAANGDEGKNTTGSFYFNNVAINLDQSDLNKAPLGLVSVVNQVNNYSENPEPVVLLFGDDTEAQRTSWMRNSLGVATKTWNGGRRLQSIVARNILTQYQKTSMLFEGTFKGSASPLDIIQVDLTNSSFFFLSGEFFIKSGQAKLTLGELFVTGLDVVNEADPFLDYGDFKDSSGNAIGNPSGISIPSPNGGTDLSNFVTKDGYNKTNWDQAYSWGNHAGRYPTYNGGGAFGTWGISISGNAATANYAQDCDKWDGRHFDDYLNQPVRKTDGVEFVSVVADTLSSKSYVSGMTGLGFKINPDGSAEFDRLTIRKDLTLNVLNVREITGSGGSLAITNVAKISKVTDMGTYWRCEIDTDGNTIAVQLRTNDVVRCQIWDGKRLKFYTGIVGAVAANAFNIDKASMTGGGLPAAGDSVFQFGNTSDTTRQGLIYLTNSDTGAPYLDILDGVNSANLAGKTKVRLGKLDGINDSFFGPLSGYGLYGQNVYLNNGRFRGTVEVTGGNAETITGAAIKAEAARIAAESAAAIDASTKANNAQNASANDAQAKANAAQTAAQNFAAAQDSTLNTNLQIYADGKVTAEEQARQYQAQQNLNAAYADASAKAQAAKVAALTEAAIDAQNRVATAINYADAKAYSGGKLLYRDPNFSEGLNGIAVYNNLGNGNVTIERIPRSSFGEGVATSLPTSSPAGIRIRNLGTASPGLGGFHFATPTRANAKFVARLIALIPVGCTVNAAANAHGDNPVEYWVTSQLGTGKWEEYIYVTQCGKTGMFSSINFFYLQGAEGTEWYLATATAYDVTDSEVDYIKDASAKALTAQTEAINIAGSYAQGLANIAQANAISTAATDAQNKANAAYNNAVSAATSYAATVANNAASQAEINAAADALNKANAAYNNAVGAANAQYQALTASLKGMAYQDLVELSKLGNTIIEGGKIKTVLLDADAIRANIVNAAYIEALVITVKNLKTAAIGKRVEINGIDNNVTILNDNNNILIQADDDSADDGTTSYVDGQLVPPEFRSRNYLYSIFIGGGVWRNFYANWGPGVSVGVSPTDSGGFSSLGSKIIKTNGTVLASNADGSMKSEMSQSGIRTSGNLEFYGSIKTKDAGGTTRNGISLGINYLRPNGFGTPIQAHFTVVNGLIVEQGDGTI